MKNPSPALQQSIRTVLWEARSGPQKALIACPFREILYGGARGGGKTEGSLGEWLLHQSIHKEKAFGIFIRRSLVQLEQTIERAKKLYEPIGATFNEQKKRFLFPNGATLIFRYLDGKKDAENYQGHEYTRVYIEELTNWPNSDPIDMMRGTLRSSVGVACKMIMTCNPGGVGHSWVKERYIDPAPQGYTPIINKFEFKDESGEMAEVVSTAIFIPAKLSDNTAMTEEAKAQYIAELHQVGTPDLVRAWLNGDWNVASGAFLNGIWDPDKHIIDPFEIPPDWKRWRAMDWGSAKPYSVGWYTKDYDGRVIRYRELYGYGGRANVGTRETATQVAKAIKKIEKAEVKKGCKFYGSVADSAIFQDMGNEKNIATLFEDQKIYFNPSKKGRDSRVNGNQLVVDVIRKGQFAVFSTCRHFIRTVPVLPIDEKNPEDVDTDAEDHVFDELRYSIRSIQPKTKKKEDNEPRPGTYAYMEKHNQLT